VTRPRRTNETSPPVAVKHMTVGAVLVPAIHVLAYRGTGGRECRTGQASLRGAKRRTNPESSG
jgi:hypothetical protein